MKRWRAAEVDCSAGIETERDRETERQRDRETERQRDRDRERAGLEMRGGRCEEALAVWSQRTLDSNQSRTARGTGWGGEEARLGPGADAAPPPRLGCAAFEGRPAKAPDHAHPHLATPPPLPPTHAMRAPCRPLPGPRPRPAPAPGLAPRGGRCTTPGVKDGCAALQACTVRHVRWIRWRISSLRKSGRCKTPGGS